MAKKNGSRLKLKEIRQSLKKLEKTGQQPNVGGLDEAVRAMQHELDRLEENIDGFEGMPGKLASVAEAIVQLRDRVASLDRFSSEVWGRLARIESNVPSILRTAVFAGLVLLALGWSLLQHNWLRGDLALLRGDVAAAQASAASTAPRLAAIELALVDASAKVGEVWAKTGDASTKLADTAAKVGETSARVGEIAGRVGDTSAKLDQLGTSVSQALAALRTASAELAAGVAAVQRDSPAAELGGQLERLGASVGALEADHDRMRDAFSRQDEILLRLEASLSELLDRHAPRTAARAARLPELILRAGEALEGGRYAEARSVAARARELDPDRQEPVYDSITALALHREGLPGSAVAAWQRVLALDPVDDVAWHNLGASHRCQAAEASALTERAARNREAEQAFRRSLELRADARTSSALADVLIDLGQEADALTVLDSVVEPRIDSGRIQFQKARIQALLGHAETCRAALDRALGAPDGAIWAFEALALPELRSLHGDPAFLQRVESLLGPELASLVLQGSRERLKDN